jgi:hypothetical protein
MKPKFICFTGHRDKTAKRELLVALAEKYPESVWIIGDAIGFDEQVKRVAYEEGIQTIIVPPAYKHPNDTKAPLRRNDLMLSLCDHVVALYDGRITGGTFYTIREAKKLGLPVKYLKPIEVSTSMIYEKE